MDTAEILWQRYQSGDEEAFDELLHRLRLPLIFFADRILKDPEEAEDVVIDVLVDLLAHPKRYRPGTSLKTYLFILTRSRCLDCLRRRRHWVPLPEDLPAGETLEAAVLTDQRRRLLHSAMAALSSDTQQALHLVYFEDMTYADAARVMGKTVKQIDNLLSRGKTALRKILSEEGAELI